MDEHSKKALSIGIVLVLAVIIGAVFYFQRERGNLIDDAEATPQEIIEIMSSQTQNDENVIPDNRERELLKALSGTSTQKTEQKSAIPPSREEELLKALQNK